MKKIAFFALLFAVLQSSLIAQEERNTLWLGGMGQTSAGWENAQSHAKLTLGYKLKVISSFNYNAYAGVAGSASTMGGEVVNGGFADVLGIGHDGGGLVLRQMAKDPNSKLTALILDGVPNQGALAIQKMLPLVGAPAGAQSRVDKLINEVLAFKSNATQCNACQIVENFKVYSDQVKLSTDNYREYAPNSPIIQNLGTPNIPYAVIWGNETTEDGLSLTRLLGSNAQSGVLGDDKGYLDCYQDEIRDRKTAIKDAFINQTLDNILGLANTVSKFVVASNGVPKPPPAAIGDLITGSISAIFNQVKNVRKKNFDLAEVMECELIHQALNSYWSLLVSPTYTLQTGVYTYEIDGLEACLSTCVDEPDPQVYGYCQSWCYNNPQPPIVVTVPFEYYSQEPHDGLLTKTEQSLPGAAKTYEAKGINHFQEQFLNYQQIEGPFVDLFNGNAGLAFKVPK